MQIVQKGKRPDGAQYSSTLVEKRTSSLASPANKDIIEIPVTRMAPAEPFEILHRGHVVQLKGLSEMRLLLIDKINEAGATSRQ